MHHQRSKKDFAPSEVKKNWKISKKYNCSILLYYYLDLTKTILVKLQTEEVICISSKKDFVILEAKKNMEAEK